MSALVDYAVTICLGSVQLTVCELVSRYSLVLSLCVANDAASSICVIFVFAGVLEFSKLSCDVLVVSVLWKFGHGSVGTKSGLAPRWSSSCSCLAPTPLLQPRLHHLQKLQNTNTFQIPKLTGSGFTVQCALLGCASLALVVISYYAYAYPSLVDLIVSNVCWTV